MDGDGTEDLVTGSFGGVLYVLYGRDGRDAGGLRQFAPPVVLSDLTGDPLCMGMYRTAGASADAVRPGAKDERARMLTAVPFDWDGDGDLDLVAGESDGRIMLFENDGTKTEPEFLPVAKKIRAGRKSLWVRSGHSMMTLGDWTGDGLLDVISGSRNGAVFLWAGVEPPSEGTGPAFAKPVKLIDDHEESEDAAPASGPARYTQPHLADLDGDGRPELLVGDFRVESSKGETETRKAHGFIWVYRRPKH